MLTGAGVLSAFDKRTNGSAQHLGGLLQSATYIAGNSGGLWLVVLNLLANGLPVYETIMAQKFDHPLIEGVADVPITGEGLVGEANDFGVLSADVQTQIGNDSVFGALLDAFFSRNNSTKLSGAALVRKTAATVTTTLKFFRDLSIETEPKKKAGFEISLTDYWGRALTKSIFPPSRRSLDLTFSSLAEQESFRNFSQPFPLLGSVERRPGVSESSESSHLFEFTPYEFGSWDDYLDAFVDTKFLGTTLKDGRSQLQTKNSDFSLCVANYDNLGLIAGTSSSLFNTVFQVVLERILQMEKLSSLFFLQILKIFGLANYCKRDSMSHPEYALFAPNPFHGLQTASPFNTPGYVQGSRPVSHADKLYLADGGDDGQNIPFHPLLARGRRVEVIFALDATSDEHNFPNGSLLWATAERYHSTRSSLAIPTFSHSGTLKRIFPFVPSMLEFKAREMARRPMFLGCDLAEDFPPVHEGLILGGTAPKLTIWDSYQPPLIVYFANHNHSFASNVSTFRTTYTKSEVASMVQNGYEVATNNNSTQYSRCVGCALLKRRADSRASKIRLPEFCAPCFAEYCYKRIARFPR